MSMEDRRLFVELVDAGSYAATARKLGVARSTVMRRIEALEASVGVTLVHRAGRSLVVTEAGKRLVDGLRGVFRSLDRLEEEVRSAEGEAAGTLRIWLPLLGTSWRIVEALADFASLHPQIALRVDLGRSPQKSGIGDFDVMLQLGHRNNPELQTRILYREQLILVASPGYLERQGTPHTLEELAEHVAIEQRDISGRVAPWRLPDGTRVRIPRAAVSTHSMAYVYEFALRGVGIGRVSRTRAQEALDDGRLAQILPQVQVEEPLGLVYLPDPSPTTRAFLEFMTEQVASLTRTGLARDSS